MAWIGKLSGGFLGLVTLGPVGAIVGAALGHQFDRGVGTAGPRLTDWFGPPPATATQRRQLLFETTFLALGRLAKADGRVSEAEIASARTIMQELALGPDETRRAVELFTAGKDPAFPLAAQLGRLRAACRQHPEVLRAFLELQLRFLMDKERIEPEERRVLGVLAGGAGIGRLELLQLELLVRARHAARATGQHGPGPTHAGSLDEAYRVLGVDPSAPDSAVKTAYRRLMNRHHPDKQAARGESEAAQDAAEDRTRRIRAAYELIRRRRGFR